MQSWYYFREGKFLSLQLLGVMILLVVSGRVYYNGYFAPRLPIYSREWYSEGHYLFFAISMAFLVYSLAFCFWHFRNLKQRIQGLPTSANATAALVLGSLPILFLGAVSLLTELAAGSM
ncbi:hypothetical protein [Hymenobacter saemangeumensis]|uniref:hypothetical protein n=1 Tax=Hymenobacter saemangeumensis TaxID=1084522 RepID=UPI0031EA6BA6